MSKGQGSAPRATNLGRGRRRSFVVVATIAAALVVSIHPALAASTHVLRGTVVLRADTSWPAGSTSCTGPVGSYADVASGARVKVTDGSGHVLATATLGAGTVGEVALDGTYGSCAFPFQTKLAERGRYAVIVGHHPASIYLGNPDDGTTNDTTTLAEMRAAHWTRSVAVGFVPVGQVLNPP